MPRDQAHRVIARSTRLMLLWMITLGASAVMTETVAAQEFASRTSSVLLAMEAHLGPDELATLGCSAVDVRLVMDRLHANADLRAQIQMCKAGIAALSAELLALQSAAADGVDAQAERERLEQALHTAQSERTTQLAALRAIALDGVASLADADRLAAVPPEYTKVVTPPYRLASLTSDSASRLADAFAARQFSLGRGEAVPNWALLTLAEVESQAAVSQGLSRLTAYRDEARLALGSWLAQ